MDATKKFIVPREGVLVRDPRTKKIIPKEGAYVTWIGPSGRYWRRRVNCKDVIISEPKQKE